MNSQVLLHIESKKKLTKTFFKDIDCDIEAHYKVKILKDKIGTSSPRWIHK